MIIKLSQFESLIEVFTFYDRFIYYVHFNQYFHLTYQINVLNNTC
jgi:hypothetical protein